MLESLNLLGQTSLAGEKATEDFGARLGSILKAGDWIGLIGQLGAGKTTLVRGVLQSFGLQDVQSPTYTLINQYQTNPKVNHLDLYRLENAEDLESIGYWDLEEDAITVVEWIDKIEEAWNGDGLILKLEYASDSRIISGYGAGDWSKRLHELWQVKE